MRNVAFILLFGLFSTLSFSQSIARQWNEEVLNGIRNDFARPTIHARNLFHTSVAMYDAWAIFDVNADTFFLGKTVGGFHCDFEEFTTSENISEARKKAISYAVYRLMLHRFSDSPRQSEIFDSINELMDELGYDRSNSSTNYTTGDGAGISPESQTVSP